MNVRRFTSLALLVATVAASTIFATRVNASEARPGLCKRNILGCGSANFKECGPANPDGDTGWWCRESSTSHCLCFNYGKWGWWFTSASDWSTVLNGVLAPNTASTLMLTASTSNHLDIWVTGDTSPDLSQAETLSGPSDLMGSIQVALGSGPPDSIPAHATGLNLNVASFTFEGSPTGPNHVMLDTQSPQVPGKYDATNGVLDFNEPLRGILYNARFPQGVPVHVRPYIVPDFANQMVTGPATAYRTDIALSLDLTTGTADVSDRAADARLGRIAATPNPFIASTGVLLTAPFTMDVAVDAFDASGRLVKRVADLRAVAGAHFVSWDGTDEAGRRVPGGMYFLQARLGGRSLTAKAVRVN